MPEKSAIANEFNRKGADFLRIEVETGLTFARIALGEDPGSEKRIRHHRDALKAYQTVLRLRGRIHIPDKTNRDIQNGLVQLRSALEKLGEKIDSAG